jgi:nitrate/nitrite-specific signal transduction histidine kinase
MGLKIMDYRARLINGRLDVANNPGGGVSVTCTFNQPPPHPGEGDAA